MMNGSDFHRIERAIHFLAENAAAQPSLAELASFLGLSEFHCHRLFRKWAGVTPKDFLQVITLSRAKGLLQAHSILDTAYSVGLSGPSRLHDLFIRYEAMTPGEYGDGGANLEIGWDHFDSPLGPMMIAATDRGICSLSFADDERQALGELKRSWPKASLLRNSASVRDLAGEVQARMLGKPRSPLALSVKGTPFQVKVWEALLRIPEGSVTTYQRLAQAIGSPGAARAVGSAVGANPVGYLIPCHRVIRSTGVVGDYHWGSARKTALLAMERGRARPPSSSSGSPPRVRARRGTSAQKRP